MSDNSPFTIAVLQGTLAVVVFVHVVHYIATLMNPGLVGLFILDSRVYVEMADAMTSQGFFGGDEAFGHAPLYPLLLSVLRRVGLGAPAFIVALQVVLGVFNACLVGLLARRAFGWAAAAPSIAFYGFYGAAMMLETKHMPSTLGVSLVLAGLCATIEAHFRRLRWGFGLAGVLIGAACLVRPNTLLFVPLATSWILWARPRVSSKAALGYAAWFLLGTAIAIAPATLRNHAITGSWTAVTAHGGMTFYQSNNEKASGTYSRIPGAVGNPRALARQLRELAETERGASMSIAEVDAYWRDQAVVFLLQDPVQTASLLLRKLRFWMGNDEISTEYVLATEREITPTLWLAPIPFALILGFAVLGLQVAISKRRFGAVAWLLVAFVASNVATIAIFYFSSRYRLPAVPMLCAFAGVGLTETIDRLRARNFERGGWLLPALVVAGVAWLPVSDDYARYASHQWFNYGIVQDERGEHHAAIVSFERAIQDRPGEWHVYYALGRAYGNANRPEDALRAYRRALEMRPQSLGVRRGIEEQGKRLRERDAP